jgi:hypothetical protein
VSEGDPWPDEPDEPEHPGQKYLDRFDESDPEEDLVPEPPEPEGGVPDDLARAFWSLVATINLGVFAASLGLMLIGFRGELVRGGAVFLLGVASLAYAGVKYRRAKRTDFSADEDDEGDPGPPAADD